MTIFIFGHPQSFYRGMLPYKSIFSYINQEYYFIQNWWEAKVLVIKWNFYGSILVQYNPDIVDSGYSEHPDIVNIFGETEFLLHISIRLKWTPPVGHSGYSEQFSVKLGNFYSFWAVLLCQMKNVINESYPHLSEKICQRFIS